MYHHEKFVLYRFINIRMHVSAEGSFVMLDFLSSFEIFFFLDTMSSTAVTAIEEITLTQ